MIVWTSPDGTVLVESECDLVRVWIQTPKISSYVNIPSSKCLDCSGSLMRAEKVFSSFENDGIPDGPGWEVPHLRRARAAYEFQVERLRRASRATLVEDVESQVPPKLAMKFLMWMPGKHADQVVEDIREGYEKRVKRDGKELADSWARSRAFWSWVALTWRSLLAVEAIRRLIGL